MTPITRNTVPIILFQICFYLFFICNTLKAQCIADAGEESTMCSTLWGEPAPLLIGGNPTALAGTAPYQYTWEINHYDILGNLRTASFFLDDTTLANPSILYHHSTIDELMVYLTVADSSGNVCIDSTTVNFSQFMYQITDHFGYINSGDSIGLLSSVSGGIPPLSYSWQPSHSLSNPNIENPIAFPDTTTFYTVIVTDTAGCTTQDPDIVEIYVGTTSIEAPSKEDFDFKLYPNPTISEINLELNVLKDGSVTFFFYDSAGKEIGVKEINEKKSTINIERFKNWPIVFYRILNTKGKQIGAGKILMRK